MCTVILTIILLFLYESPEVRGPTYRELLSCSVLLGDAVRCGVMSSVMARGLADAR